jgi:hypothetical protein
VKQEVARKNEKKLRKEINGKFNDISIAEEIHKNITVEPLFKIYKKKIYLFIDRRLRRCACFCA